MAATGEDEPINSTEELVVAVGGVNESVTAEHLSDIKCRDDDPLFTFDDENVPNPRYQLLPQPQFRHGKKKTKLFTHSNHPLEKSLPFESQSPNIY